MPYAKIGKISLYYEKKGNGFPLLLIQGLGYDHRPYMWLAGELEKNFTVIMFDNRGVGRSDVPPGPYSIEEMADDAVGMVKKLGISKIAVMGISMGGYIAQMIALKYPEIVDKLIIGCSYFSGDPSKLKMSQEALEAITRRDGTLEEIARRGLCVAFSKDYPAKHPDIFEQLVRWRLELPVTATGYFGQLQGAMGFDVEKKLSSITCPVLILHGDQDIVVPVERGFELHDAIPNSKIKVLEGCGHLFFIENIEETARTITSFLLSKKAEPGRTAPYPQKIEPWHEWDFLGKRASLSPAKIAIMDETGKEKFTYSMLNERASRVAYFLYSLGIRKGQRVGLLSQNCIPAIEIFYACAKLGAIFVPFNTRLSSAEIAKIASDVSPAILFLDKNYQEVVLSAGEAFPPRSRQIIIGMKHGIKDYLCGYDEIFAREFNEQKENAPVCPVITSIDPWVILFTGGTTGTPKGAILTHGSVFWNAINTIIGWGLRDSDVAPIFTPLFHTGGLNVLLTPLLLLGGTCVIVKSFNPDKAFDIIKRRKATYVFMVPSMFRMMMDSPKWKDEKFRTVREFVTGGAPCPKTIFSAFAEKKKNFRMGYGLTEAGPNNFYIDPQRAVESPSLVGKPLPFVEAKIVTEEGEEGKSNQVGELYLRGPHVFSGYWQKPEETKKVFEGGWLKTGDLAKVNEDGNFEIVGRKKEMFISGGENIYPVEVEEVILRHPEVKEVAVVGIPDEKWGEVGLAAVVPVSGVSITEEELKEFMKDKIARYKIPKKFIFMEELPKTSAGKVDKMKIKEGNK